MTEHTHRGQIVALITALSMPGALSADEQASFDGRIAQTMRSSFADATPEEWRTRLEQDRTQALCSHYRNAPPAEVAAAISADAKASLRYPQSGKLIGDWRRGEQIASFSGGGQLSSIAPDRAGSKRGGNCFACHTLSPREVAAGNLGPPLTGYGRVRGTSDESVRYTYEKIYNPQAYFACSFMPRFGHNGWLTPEQVADVVAFLLDPQSPVNQ